MAEIGGALSSRTVEKYSSIARVVFDFTLHLFKQFKLTDEEVIYDVCFSPFTLFTLLVMIVAGARNSTLEMLMRTVFNSPDFTEDFHVHETFQKVIRYVRALVTSNFKFANALCLQKQELREDFLNKMRYYWSVRFQLNYPPEFEIICLTINAWFHSKMDPPFREPVTTQVISARTKIGLVSNILLRTQFEAQTLSQENFMIDQQNEILVSMMTAQKTLLFGENTDMNCKIVALPLVEDDERFNMFIILPNEIDGLNNLEENLTFCLLQDMINTMEKKTVLLSLPKFKLDLEFFLENKLAKMGLESLFNCDADLSGINGNSNDLFVSTVFHQAVFEINEKFPKSKQTFSPMYSIFRVSHPFLFFVIENITGCIILWARVTRPQSVDFSQDLPVYESHSRKRKKFAQKKLFE